MAKMFDLDPTGTPELTGMTKFYDITHAVGIPIAPGDPANPANEYLDVLLIEYLLDKYYEGDAFRPAGKLVLDGVFGPMTHYWMLFFYVEMESLDEATMFQERGNFVSWARNGIGRFDNALSQSLIGRLNYHVFKKYPQMFNDLISKDAKMPPALKQAFKPRKAAKVGKAA